jgi:hypothetical protein
MPERCRQCDEGPWADSWTTRTLKLACSNRFESSQDLGKLDFQILRRTFATLAYGERKGTLKDVQTLLWHTGPDTTLLNYVKEIPDSVFGMVDAMYEGISRTDETQRLAESPTLGVH